jgi:branched-subunit amino acid ABC-type transport system permease component
VPDTRLSGSERPLEGEVLGPETPSEREARERLNFLAWLLDSSIPLPGTRFTIGLDALIGLVPVLGDLIGVALSSFIVAEAHRLGAPRTLLTRMAFNVAVEGVVGIVPLLGDVFDAGWKANQKNVRLLNAWLDQPHKARRGNRIFVALLAFALAAFIAVCFGGVYLLFAR